MAPGDCLATASAMGLRRQEVLYFGTQRVMVGLDIYNIVNSNVTLAFNQTYSPTSTGYLAPTSA